MGSTTTPAQRSLKYLRDRNYTAQVVERWNPYGRVRVDLFGFIDIVAISYFNGKIFGVQTTSAAHINDRIKKILQIKEAKYWLEAGAKIYVHGWSKKGKVGKRKLWEVNVREITLRDFNE